jgi:hypothetical protein
VTTKECICFDKNTKKIRIGTFSHSSDIRKIASLINEKVFRKSE